MEVIHQENQGSTVSNHRNHGNRRDFILRQEAIQAEAAIDIAAPPERVAAVYCDVERWGETFPATIESARVTQSGENWKQILVMHKMEGQVPNTLIEISATEIGLEESKKKFNASFLNRFAPGMEGQTHYIVHASIRLKGIYRLLKPFISGYVRRRALRQLRHFVLEPMKTAAERSRY